MSDEKTKKALSLEEAAALLGAEAPEDIGPVSIDPIGLSVLAHRIAKRLVSTGGRPTDKSWDFARKIPMKKATWTQLRTRSVLLARQGVCVAPGQLAAFALEIGLRELDAENSLKTVKTASGELGGEAYEFRPESEEEAKGLAAAASGGIW